MSEGLTPLDPVDATGRMRIALVHAADLGGGAERSVVGLHRALTAAGHYSTLFVGSKLTDEPGVVEIPYVRGVAGLRRAARFAERRFGWQDIYNPSFWHLRRLLDRRFDIVHFNSLWGSAGFADIGALPSLTRRIPGVLTMRESWLLSGHCACFDACERWRIGCGHCPDLARVPKIPTDGTRFNWNRKRRVVGRSRLHIVTVSRWLEECARLSPITSQCAIETIYNGVDLETFSASNADERSALRAELGFADSDFVVLLAGQTVEGLNTMRAPEDAIAALQEAGRDLVVRPLVIGRSGARVAAQLGAGAVAVPFQTDPAAMARYFGVADLTLVTSEAEAFGRIAAESQACGTPVVAFATGAIPEVVRSGETGIVVPRGDVSAMAQAIVDLKDDAERLSRFRIGGVAHVRSMFDQRLVAGQYLALYRRVAASQPTQVRASGAI